MIIKIIGGSALCGAVVFSGAALLSAQGARAGEDDWRFEITPYGWAKGVKGTSGGADIDFDNDSSSSHYACDMEESGPVIGFIFHL